MIGLADRGHGGDEPTILALATQTAPTRMRALLDRVRRGARRSMRLPSGRVISIEGDYGPESIAVLLASTWTGHIAVPLSPDSQAAAQRPISTSPPIEYRIPLGRSAVGRTPRRTDRTTGRPSVLRASCERPGIQDSSCSRRARPAKPKAALHDLARLLPKFQTPRQKLRTLVFLLLDHIGGINTLFYTLANGGAVVSRPAPDRRRRCASAIETHRVELLPTSPTFLNLLLLSGEVERHDLSSLRLITYGTEPMPASTLERACQAFPEARFLQTYGLTELGILRSQSRESNSLWVRIGGEGFEWKVVDGRLWIRAESAMLGYLNAPQSVRRRRLLRHRRSRRGRRRVDPVSRPQERGHQRRRQQGAPVRSRERAAEDGGRRRRGRRGGATRVDRPDGRRHRPPGEARAAAGFQAPNAPLLPRPPGAVSRYRPGST